MSLYTILVSIQAISVVLLFFGTMYIFASWRSRNYSYLFLYSLSTLINNLGYLMEMTAKTNREMLLATKIAYVGKAFIPVSLLFFACQYCGKELAKSVKVLLFLFHASVVAMVYTCEYHTLYYTSITYTESGLFPHNEFGHGIFYNFYMTLMFGYLFYVIYIAFKQCVFLKDRRTRARMNHIFYCALVSFGGLLFFQTGLSRGYDTTALAYVVCIAIMFRSIYKYDLLHALDAIKDYVVDNLTSGVIGVNNDQEIVYYNVQSKEIFPAIQTNAKAVMKELDELLMQDAIKITESRVYRISTAVLVRKKIQMGKLYVMDDITNEHAYAQRIERIAMTDEMTGLLNRHAYSQDVDQLMEKTEKKEYLVVVFDVNGLKQVNDQQGHMAGDELIKAAADCIVECFGRYGKIYRAGGDEFFAILYVTEEEFGYLKASFDEMVANWHGESVEEMTIAYGYADSRQFENVSLLDLVKLADQKMYACKMKYYKQHKK